RPSGLALAVPVRRPNSLPRVRGKRALRACWGDKMAWSGLLWREGWATRIGPGVLSRAAPGSVCFCWSVREFRKSIVHLRDFPRTFIGNERVHVYVPFLADVESAGELS